MKFLVALALIGVVAGKVVESPVDISDYHIRYGIPTAARIKAAEEALDFDGSRIVGGQPNVLGQHPYAGGLLITLTGGQTSVCSTSLLSNTRALTAAHCWRTLGSQASSFTVVFASMLLFSGGTRVTTSNVETHASWNGVIPVNDIAIIRFPHMAYNQNMQPIAIATGNNNFVGTNAVATGFGLTSDGGSITQAQFLSHVTMPVVNNSVCLAVYGILTVRDHTLCAATTGGRGTCGGDSGGPLVANNQQIGITSFGHSEGCQRGHPAGFMRVTSFATWIQQRM